MIKVFSVFSRGTGAAGEEKDNDGNDIYHSGDSMVINAMGDILYQKAHDEDVFTITLQKEDLDLIRNKFQFLRDADQFMIAND